MPARQIAFFGRPGVGTTTVVANVGAALAEAGHRVAVIGCGAAGRTTASLREGRAAPALLTNLRQTSQTVLAKAAVTGFKGILCLELGRIETESEAAIALDVAHELLESRMPRLDYWLYNASAADGDPDSLVTSLLCKRRIDQLAAVSTAEVNGLRTVNRLLQLVRRLDRDSLVEVAGIIGNKLPAPYAEAVIDSFARAASIPVAAFIPQSLVVTRSDFFGASVIDAAPLAHHAYLYRKAAHALIASRPFSQRLPPKPLDEESFTEWSLDWGERLFDLGEGIIDSGGGI